MTFPWSHFQCIPANHYDIIPVVMWWYALSTSPCRHYFYLQLRSSLLEGRETVLQDEHVDLAALSLQADFGDCRGASGDLSSCAPHLLHLHQGIQPAVLDRYKELRGLRAAVAEEEFLGKAQCLDSYGVERHLAVDGKGRSCTVAVGPSAIVVTNEFTHSRTR